MRIWVDADVCPSVIKEILFRAAERAGIKLTLGNPGQLREEFSLVFDNVIVAHVVVSV